MISRDELSRGWDTSPFAYRDEDMLDFIPTCNPDYSPSRPSEREKYQLITFGKPMFDKERMDEKSPLHFYASFDRTLQEMVHGKSPLHFYASFERPSQERSHEEKQHFPSKPLCRTESWRRIEGIGYDLSRLKKLESLIDTEGNMKKSDFEDLIAIRNKSKAQVSGKTTYKGLFSETDKVLGKIREKEYEKLVEELGEEEVKRFSKELQKDLGNGLFDLLKKAWI